MKNVLLVVSFGTTSPDTRESNIGAVEKAIKEAVSCDHAGDGFEVRRCFTSKVVIRSIEKNEGIRIDSIEDGLSKAADKGIRKLAVQPTHLMTGLEYEKIKNTLSAYRGSFDRISLGDPLLTSENDIIRTADALIDASRCFEDGNTALVFMGHGTNADSNRVYKEMQDVLLSKGRSNYCIGTVEAEPSIDSVISAVRASGCKRVVLRPLMLVAGNHAVNDMASRDDPESWYSRFTSLGYKTECLIEGLGELRAIRDIYADHAKKAISALI